MKNIRLNENMILSEMAYWRVPGICVSYVSPKAEGAKGFGIRNINGEAVSEDTVFCIASCSKACLLYTSQGHRSDLQHGSLFHRQDI